MGDLADSGTYCQRIDGLLKLEASRENAFVLKEIERSEMTPLPSDRRRYCCGVSSAKAELLLLMVLYDKMDVTVNYPHPLSVAMFHHCCIVGKIHTCT